jgi:hypothetical protein
MARREWAQFARAGEGNPRQGHVNSQRSIRSLVAVLGVAASLCAVDSAWAGSLLSGYGGPGQGNQAILGSTLLGGTSGGGGGAASGGGEGGATSSSAANSAVPSAPVRGSAGSSRHAHHSASGAARSVTRGAPAGPTQLAPAAASTKEGSQPLGLSGRDLLYVLLALALLAATAALTLRLARPAPPAGSTKGMGRGTRVTE